MGHWKMSEGETKKKSVYTIITICRGAVLTRVDFFASKPRKIVYKPRFSDHQSNSLEASEVALVVYTANQRPWLFAIMNLLMSWISVNKSVPNYYNTIYWMEKSLEKYYR